MDREMVRRMWRKAPSVLDNSLDSVQSLARRLGVERRQNARALYPRLTTGPFPAISFAGQFLKANDLSVGGCAVFDPNELMGKDVGIELTLTLHFADGNEHVASRLVGRVDLRRHLQFLDLPAARAERLKAIINEAVCGSALRLSLQGETSGPWLEAREIWNSLAGDSLTLVDDLHRMAQLVTGQKNYTLYKQAWPMDASGQQVSREVFQGLVLFLANIPHPSSALVQLRDQLEMLLLEAGR